MKKESNQQEAAKGSRQTPGKKKKRDMSSRERVQLLQRKLYLKAKQDKDTIIEKISVKAACTANKFLNS